MRNATTLSLIFQMLPYLDGDVLCASYIISVNWFRYRFKSSDFNNRNEILPAKFLKQVYRYHKIRKNCFKVLLPSFMSRHNVGFIQKKIVRT